MRRLRSLLALCLLPLAVVALASPARAAVADTWVKTSADHWIRSLDYVTPGTLVAGSEGDGVFTASTAAGPWTDVSGNLSATAKHVHQAVGQGGQIYLATSAGLFKGSGNGSWAQLGDDDSTPQSQRLDMGGVQSVVFPTGSASYLVAAIAGTGGPGVYYSSDSGTKWTRATGLTSAVFYLTASGSTMYAAADTGFYKSTDAGKSWVLRSDGVSTAEFALRIAVSPLNSQQLIGATTGGVFRSDDGGLSWYAANGSGAGLLNGGTVRAFQLVPSTFWGGGPPRIVVGTDHGVWATADGGDSWAKMSDTQNPMGIGMQDETVWALNIGFAGPSLMAGTQGHGIYALPLQPAEAPASIPAPSGSPVQNQVLTANTGVWGGTGPFVYRYEWNRCTQSSAMDAAGNTCSAITGETDRTYTITSGDVGKYLRVRITAINILTPFFSTSKLSASVGPVTAPATTITAPNGFPDLLNDGSAPWGKTITVDPGGNWKSNNVTMPTSFVYAFDRCHASDPCVRVQQGSSPSYTTTLQDVNSSVLAYAIGTIGNSSSGERFAGTSGTVFEQTPTNVTAPKIIGTAYVGQTLQSTAGLWTGTHPTYGRRWLRCNSAGLQCNPGLPVVTTPTYQVTAADKGYTLKVEVTAYVTDDSATRHATVESARTAVVTNPPPPPPSCASLKAAVAKATNVVNAAKKALAKAKKTHKQAKIKKAKAKLKSANAALAKARARVKQYHC